MIKMIITITIIYHNHYHNYLGDSIWAAAGTILAALSRALHVMNNLMIVKIMIVNVMLVNVLNVKNMIININIMMIVSLTVNLIILNIQKIVIFINT